MWGSPARTFAQRQQSQQRQQHQQSQQQSSQTLKVRGTKSVFGSSYANFVVIGSAAVSLQLAARSSVRLSCSLRGCDNASLARTRAPARAEPAASDRACSRPHKHLKLEGPTVCLGAPYTNVVVIGSAAVSLQLAPRSSVRPSCSLRGCDNASPARALAQQEQSQQPATELAAELTSV